MNLRELTYRIYGDDRLSGKLNKISAAGIKTDKSLGGASKKTSSLKNSLKGATAEIPGLGAGLRFLTNPLGLAAGGAMLLAGGLNKAKNEAIAFNNEFRELINLNLDKSPEQMEKLKNQILQTSYNSGFNPLQASKGFYDVQSITGEYGAVVQSIVGQTGSFAQVMRADFNKTVAGSAQAMEIYGFKVNQVQDYLKSLVKTVNVGYTSFDELSKVQVEYANAAASVGQSFDNANRVFSVFSKAQKNVNIAATMTKTAFEDLTKKNTLEGLKQIGVSVFDAKGQMRGVDKILEDLIPKLSAMSDLQFATLKEEIGGSEGIRGMLDLARNSADEMLAGFKQFDNVTYNSLEAYKKAIKDATFLSDQLSNKLSASWAGLGQSILPVWNRIKLISIGLLDNTRQFMDEIGTGWNWLFNRSKYNDDVSTNRKNAINSRANASKTKYEAAIGDINSKTPLSEVNKLKDQIRGDISSAKEKVKERADSKLLKQAYTKQVETLSNFLKKVEERTKVVPENSTKGSGGTGSGTGKVSNGLSEVSGGGSKATSITFHIAKLNESININTTNLTEATPEIEEKMTETLVRAIGGAEQITMN